jgi:hypothetical protein
VRLGKRYHGFLRLWTLHVRVYYSVVALADLAFVWELSLWNLLGYHF